MSRFLPRTERGRGRRGRRIRPIGPSPISCWEIATLLEKKRISLDRAIHHWMADLLADEQVEIAPLSPQAAVGAAVLARAGHMTDPADRLLYATARELIVPLITKDSSISRHARDARDVRVIW
jgi:PIN domain nuclease of toxin-antitoxin system